MSVTFGGRPCMCRVYRSIKLSNASFSDQPLNKIQLRDDRKKYNLDLAWDRVKLLYHFNEYLKILNQTTQTLPKYWIRVMQTLPQLLNSKNESSTNDIKPKTNIESTSTDESDLKTTEVTTLDIKDATYKLPLIGGWKTSRFQNDITKNHDNLISKWDHSTSVSSSTSTMARTKHLLVLIDTAESVQSRLKRIEDLVEHIIRHPDAKLMAVKEGAIRKLLQIERRSSDHATHRVLREAFALLGHVSPLPCKGIRILSVDGGGIRGIAVIDMLKKLEELTGKKIYEMFDYICGVSTGSILVSCIGTPQGMSLAEALTMYVEFGTKLFTQSAFWGVSNLVLSRAYYDTTMFEQLLKKFVGETPLIKTNADENCPKLASVSTVMNQSSIMPFVFRNYSLPCDRQSQYLGSCKYTLFESVRASGAAPTVFQELCLDGMIHQDGGILVNNPCALAIHEAKLLWPDSEIQCVVSCGTGRHAPISVAANSSKAIANASSVSWKTLFNRILESATDTEAVHTMLNDLLPPNVYFRFNPYLTNIIPMHENRAEKISQLREETSLYIRRNEEKFVDAAASLLIKRTATQKMKDFIDAKSYEYGWKNSVCKL